MRHLLFSLAILLSLAPSGFCAEDASDPRILQIEQTIARLDQESKSTRLALEAENKEARRTGLKAKLSKQKKMRRELEKLLKQAKQSPGDADWTEIDEALRRSKPFERREQQLQQREEILRERND